MMVNGIDLSEFNARQLRFVKGNIEIAGKSEWGSGRLFPSMLRPEFGFRDYSLSFSVRGKTKEEIQRKSYTIVSLFREVVDFRADEYANSFKLTLKAHKHIERTVDTWHVVELDLVGYEYGATRALTVGQSQLQANTTRIVPINNQGTLITPVIITLLRAQGPFVGTDSLDMSISGLCRNSPNTEQYDIQLYFVDSNKLFNQIVIDGETGRVRTSYVESDMQYSTNMLVYDKQSVPTIPSLLPGTNEIVFKIGKYAGQYSAVTIGWTPRYL